MPTMIARPPRSDHRIALDALTVGWYATGHQRIGDVTSQLPDGSDKDRVVERFRALAPAALPGAW